MTGTRDDQLWVHAHAERLALAEDLTGLMPHQWLHVTLCASDGPFAAGNGPLATGPPLALVMVTAGRFAYLEELHGRGVEILRSRC